MSDFFSFFFFLSFQDDFLYSVSVLSGILCTVLAVIKFMLGKVLTSRALITDGECDVDPAAFIDSSRDPCTMTAVKQHCNKPAIAK